MGKLKNFEKAYISLEKLTSYCLNEYHPYGKEKAIAFKSVLGIGVNDAPLLKDAILQGLSENECITRAKDEYGERFTVVMKIRIFKAEANVTTGWIFRTSEDYPRLTSCYIKRRVK
ncbi:MAG: hypothetical protein K2U26_08880 [Cyclobacteriaceae bacterium]|nr:hypothetical protein [Cyclobacteriaceae bacterium]